MAISKVILNGTTLIDTTDKTVTSSTLVSPNTALGADGTTVTGTLVAKTSTDVTVSGATVTIPSGVYSSQIEKSVASGTAGTPTASKELVAANTMVVTPTVTNTTGYITGGTKTGTDVTVTASEVTSGTKTITTSGSQIDVANYKYASVAAGTATTPATTITANPTITVNSSGLITATNYSTKSITPTVSAGYITTGTSGTVTVSGINTEQLIIQESSTWTPTTTNQTIYSQQFLIGTQTILGDANLISANIASGVTIFGVVGTHSGGVTPTGTYNVSAAGTFDVTNYANISVPAGSVVLPDLYYTESNGLDVTISVNNSGLVTTEIDLDNNYDAIFETNFYSGYISEYSGNGGIRVIANHTYQLSSQAAQTITPTTTNQTISSQRYLTGTQTILGDVNLISANIASGVTIFGVVGTYTGTTPTAMVLPTTTSTTSIGTRVATFAPSTVVQYLNIPIGYNSSSQFYSINSMSAINFPNAFSLNSIGTLVTTLTTLTRFIYLNIPKGYNDTSKYYIVSVPTVTLPTTTNVTSVGTLVATITPTASVQYLNFGTGNIESMCYYKINSASGGGSNYNLLYSGTITASTTSTTATLLSTITLSTAAYTSTKILYVKIRDSAGARKGRFVGTDNYLFNFNAANSGTAETSAFARIIHRKASGGTFTTTTASGTTGYGVYAYSIQSNGKLKIYVRYNSTNSLTINGTYNIEVYLLDYASTEGNPYNY